MLKNSLFILFTGSDPWAIPTGGQSTFAKHMLVSYGSEIAITSYCNDNTIVVGQWVKRKYYDNDIWFFNRGSNAYKRDRKPIVPKRIKSYFNILKYRRKIRNSGIDNIFVDSPESLLAIYNMGWKSVCYRFAGVNNPVSHSRYAWAKVFGDKFEFRLVNVLKKLNPEAILASADKLAINEFHKRTNYILDINNFHQFPTRVNTDFFKPGNKENERLSLNLPLNSKIFVTTGRVSFIKGWDLLLSAFKTFLINHSYDPLLIFVGDGEDRQKLLSMAKEMGIERSIIVTGFQSQEVVLSYLISADVCLVGSLKEGWSLAMCEMISCGKSIVSTDVSGARDMIKDGKNGFVVVKRDPELFAKYMFLATGLTNAKKYSLEISKNYAVKNLSSDLAKYWRPGLKKTLYK